MQSTLRVVSRQSDEWEGFQEVGCPPSSPSDTDSPRSGTGTEPGQGHSDGQEQSNEQEWQPGGGKFTAGSWCWAGDCARGRVCPLCCVCGGP